MSHKIVGMDIGENEIKLAFKNGKHVSLYSERLPENLVRDGRITMPDSMAEFIRRTFKKWHIRCKDCAVALPDSLSFFRHINVPIMTEAQLKINLPYEFKDYISGDGDKYFYDYALEGYELDDAGAKKSMNMFAAAVSKSVIDRYIEIMTKARLRLAVALPVEASYVNLMREYIRNHPEHKDREICIADIGNSHTAIHIMGGADQRALRSLDTGSRDIDRVIAAALNVDEYIACTHKENNFNNVRSLDVCMDVYNRLAVDILKAVNFYRFSNPDNTMTDIYIAGGGAEIDELREAIAMQPGLDLTMHSVSELYPADVTGTCSERAQIALGVVLQ